MGCDTSEHGTPVTRPIEGAGLGPHGAVLLRAAGRLVSPPRGRARLLILIYHRVLPHRDPARPRAIDAETFNWQMAVLARCFNVLPLGHAIDRMADGTLPARAAAVTFDDGYADNHDLALPILESLGIAATFFITTGCMGRCMWNDAVGAAVRNARGGAIDASPAGLGVMPVGNDDEQRAAIQRILDAFKDWRREPRDEAVAALLDGAGVEAPTGLMMNSGQVRAMRSAGMEIGAHTVNHPILARAPMAEAEREIGESRDVLEGVLDEKVTLFAYPNGRPGIDYTRDHVQIVRRLGFRGAVSTAWGANRHGRTDPYQLRRFTPWDRTPVRFGARLLAQCFRVGVDELDARAGATRSLSEKPG